jgi:hypothetical protein
MDYQHHARLSPYSREVLVRNVVEGRLSRQSAAKWMRRFHQEGFLGLQDRSSRPHRSPRPTSAELAGRVEQLRHQR